MKVGIDQEDVNAGEHVLNQCLHGCHSQPTLHERDALDDDVLMGDQVHILAVERGERTNGGLVPRILRIKERRHGGGIHENPQEE